MISLVLVAVLVDIDEGVWAAAAGAAGGRSIAAVVVAAAAGGKGAVGGFGGETGLHHHPRSTRSATRTRRTPRPLPTLTFTHLPQRFSVEQYPCEARKARAHRRRHVPQHRRARSKQAGGALQGHTYAPVQCRILLVLVLLVLQLLLLLVALQHVLCELQHHCADSRHHRVEHCWVEPAPPY